MRIALVSMHTSPSAIPGSGDAGGMNVVVAAAARALAARGHEVVVATRATSALAPGESALGSPPEDPPHRALVARQAPPTLVALAAGAVTLGKSDLPATVPEFAAGLRALGPFDAVHSHYWLSGVAAQEAFPGQTNAVTFHTLAAQKNARLAAGDIPEPAHRVAAENELAARAFVIAGSQSELAGVTEFAGEPPHGSSIVHPGVDTELFRPGPPGGSVPLRITVLGRVQPLKGQDLAVRAAAALARRDPELFARTEWIIAGEPTPGAERYAAELRAIVASHGIAAQVRFLPAQSRTAAAGLLAESAIVLVPSHSETFGLTALEAAASGVPVIAAGHTGLLEAVPDGVSGLHVTDRDPETWARAIAELLHDEPRRARLARSALQHARQHDWAAHAASLERIYAGLAG